MGNRLVDFVVSSQGQQVDGLIRRGGVWDEFKEDAIIEINSAGPNACQFSLELMAMQRRMKRVCDQLAQGRFDWLTQERVLPQFTPE